MKKLLFVALFACITFVATAQLNIKSVNSINERFYKDTWVTITWNGSEFKFNSSDPVTALTLSFTLGKNKAQALTTLNQIYSWFESAETKSSITFEDGDNDITLYKLDGMQIVISTGDSEFIRKEYSRRISGLLLGTPQFRKKESTPHFSFISRKALKTSIEEISALSDPKYLGDNPEEDSAYQAARAEKQQKEQYKQVLNDCKVQITALEVKIDSVKNIKDKAAEKQFKQELKEARSHYDEIYNKLFPPVMDE